MHRLDREVSGIMIFAKSPEVQETLQRGWSGTEKRYVALVEGMVARFKAELGPDTRVIGTGGLARVIVKETDVIEVFNPWLTLEGLRLIWEMNQ